MPITIQMCLKRSFTSKSIHENSHNKTNQFKIDFKLHGHFDNTHTHYVFLLVMHREGNKVFGYKLFLTKF